MVSARALITEGAYYHYRCSRVPRCARADHEPARHLHGQGDTGAQAGPSHVHTRHGGRHGEWRARRHAHKHRRARDQLRGGHAPDRAHIRLRLRGPSAVDGRHSRAQRQGHTRPEPGDAARIRRRRRLRHRHVRRPVSEFYHARAQHVGLRRPAPGAPAHAPTRRHNGTAIRHGR